jgi:acetylglutamate kinase
VGGQGIRGVNPYHAAVSIQGISVYDGAPTELDRTGLRARMREPEVRVEVALRAGTASAHAWGCDLSYDYVKINADYTSLIVERPEGGVGRDDRFSNYSPAFKVTTLVQALSYIGRFKGQRCVIQYGGQAMTRESLKRTFCEDVLLLRSVGLHPIVVHGGGPDITRALEKLGTVPEFIDGQRVTNAADLKVVEMVLTGSVNTELVTLLNQSGANAVGLSGKDAALLRARKAVRSDGKDLGQVGELVEVNRSLLELLLQQNYVPVISPVGMGHNGDGYNLPADEVAAGVAASLGAQKLIFLADVPGLFEGDELLSELTAEQLREKVNAGALSDKVQGTTAAILKAVSGGVPAVHVIDGRTPHSVIAELFTDKGVGTIVRAEAK